MNPYKKTNRIVFHHTIRPANADMFEKLLANFNRKIKLKW